MIRFLLAILTTSLTMLAPVPSVASELDILARPGPWPVADRLIAYRGKVWFSTAVKGVDHNSADIWSLDPNTNLLSFERFLFSQDAGHPVVHKGLLYWPQEDMRIGLGAGVVSVTNGTEWRDLNIPVGDHMMHTHSTAEWRGQLVTAMAGWNSAIAVSGNAGKSWRLLANDAPQSGSFHRYNDLATLGQRLFVRHWQTTGLSLAELRDGRVVPVSGWPRNRYFSRLVHFDGALYTLVDAADGRAELWRVGKGVPRLVDTNINDLDMRQILSDGERLWIVVRSGNGGELWSSGDGVHFTVGDSFNGGVSHSAVALAPGKIYVAGAGDDGKAIVWGPTAFGITAPVSRSALPQQRGVTDPDFELAAEAGRIRRALSDSQSYQNHGRALREILQSALAQRPPPDFFASLLETEFPKETIDIFGGNATVEAGDMATWQILAAMALNGDRSVPTEILSKPWSRRPNRPQKWFDPLLIAMHAVQQSGQNDHQTVDALIGRLDSNLDPDWLTSQVTGTLAAITGKDFAHDTVAWKSWWASIRDTWPKKAS